MSRNFPIGADGTLITGTATTTAHDLGIAAQYQNDIMIDNPGPNDVYVRAGMATVVATSNSMRVAAGEKGAYFKGPFTHLAVFAPNGNQDIRVFLGEGA